MTATVVGARPLTVAEASTAPSGAPHGSRGSAHVRLLGSVQLVRPSGEVVVPPSAGQRRLLALLALHAGRTLRAELLCDRAQVSFGALRTTVSRLRRLVGDEVLLTEAVGYRLDLETDADHFTVGLAASGPGPDELPVLDRALALWRGRALDEFCHEPWACGEAARLEELRAVAVDRRAAALMAIGRYGEAVAELDAHVVVHPLRDRAWGMLIEALAADGRRTDALRAYQRYRSHLAETAGLDPSPSVRAIERRVAADDAPVTRG